MTDQDWSAAYLRLPAQAALKDLESPFVYHTGRDELYEIDDAAYAFLLRCDGASRGRDLTADGKFVEYCLDEGLLDLLSRPDPVPVTVNKRVLPSLRYLELQLTSRCNLACLHCYLGPAGRQDMALADAVRIAQAFSDLGGLRLMVSGGEPLLYGALQTFLAQTANLKLHRVLFTNGTLLTDDMMDGLKIEEIQFSLDGWMKGHDMLRGPGTFARTLRGVQAAKNAGIPLSFATMIHRGNLEEFEQMQRFIKDMGAIEWGIDFPVPAGALRNHQDLLPSYEEAAPFMAYAYGGGYHGASDGHACGRHLLTVLPGGEAVKCGFYGETVLGDARRDLEDCWLKLEHTPLARLECKDCPVLAECAGGCRFRAPHPLAPDPFMCVLYGQQQVHG